MLYLCFYCVDWGITLTLCLVYRTSSGKRSLLLCYLDSFLTIIWQVLKNSCKKKVFLLQFKLKTDALSSQGYSFGNTIRHIIEKKKGKLWTLLINDCLSTGPRVKEQQLSRKYPIWSQWTHNEGTEWVAYVHIFFYHGHWWNHEGSFL